MSQYYYLVSGLPDVSIEDTKLSYSVSSFKQEIYPLLSTKDQRLLDLFYGQYDLKNLLILLKDREGVMLKNGLYERQELLDLIETAKQAAEADKRYPSYFSSFLEWYFHPDNNGSLSCAASVLSGMYYAYGMRQSNDFIARWFEFNLNLSNILSAFIAKRHAIEVAGQIVGENEIAEALKTSSARDFGLSQSVDYFPELIRINESSDLMDKEKKLDLLAFKWLEEASFFHYFSVEKLFVFLVKLSKIERWLSLDQETGEKMFRSLIAGLKEGAPIPEEFIRK